MAITEDVPDTSDGYGLYSFVSRQAARLPTPDWFASHVMDEFTSVWESPTNRYIRDHFRQFASELYQFEEYTNVPPFPADYSPHTFAAARYRDELIAMAFRIGEPDSLVNVLRTIATMMLTHICDLIPPPYNEEVARPDGYIPAIYKMCGISEFISFLLEVFAEEKIRESAHIFPRLRAALAVNNTPASLKLRTQAARDFSISPVELVSSHFKDTPLMKVFELKIPIAIPPEFKQEQARTPVDPDHPKHYCYQCKRRLPRDFALKYWQELDFPKGPFFHTEQCKITTLNRHRVLDGDYVETYRSLMKEYVVYVQCYENEKLAKDNLMREKQRIEQSKIEDRDYREWQRDTERARSAWEKEYADEQERLAEERALQERIVPRTIPTERRYEHTHILGPSGSGKTSLIQQIVLPDLTTPEPPAYVIIDPKGEMVDRLSRLAIFNEKLRNRLVVVDPFQQPALNLFQATGISVPQMVSHFSYIFSTTRQQLTGKQIPCFAFCVRLLFEMPEANLYTLMDLLGDRANKRAPDPRFQTAIAQLTQPAAQRFFETDYYSANYASTREEIKSRVWAVLGDDHLGASLNATERRLDVAACIRERKVLLVNTRMVSLKLAHQILGRYILSLAIDAIQNRAGTPKSTWHPAYIVIDEFQEFADSEKTPEMLRLIREYNGGAILAHQNMYCEELDDSTRTAISTNTSIKYASSPEARDLNYMAHDLRCEPEFFRTHAQTHSGVGHFACFVRGMTPPMQHPFVVDVPFGQINQYPKMSDDEHEVMMQQNYHALRSQSATMKKTLHSPENQPEIGYPPNAAKAAASLKPQMTDYGQKPPMPPLHKPPSPPDVIDGNLSQDSVSPTSGPADPGEPSSNWKP